MNKLIPIYFFLLLACNEDEVKPQDNFFENFCSFEVFENGISKSNQIFKSDSTYKYTQGEIKTLCIDNGYQLYITAGLLYIKLESNSPGIYKLGSPLNNSSNHATYDADFISNVNPSSYCEVISYNKELGIISLKFNMKLSLHNGSSEIELKNGEAVNLKVQKQNSSNSSFLSFVDSRNNLVVSHLPSLENNALRKYIFTSIPFGLQKITISIDPTLGEGIYIDNPKCWIDYSSAGLNYVSGNNTYRRLTILQNDKVNKVIKISPAFALQAFQNNNLLANVSVNEGIITLYY
jgi:hypothetical protein